METTKHSFDPNDPNDPHNPNRFILQANNNQDDFSSSSDDEEKNEKNEKKRKRSFFSNKRQLGSKSCLRTIPGLSSTPEEKMFQDQIQQLKEQQKQEIDYATTTTKATMEAEQIDLTSQLNSLKNKPLSKSDSADNFIKSAQKKIAFYNGQKSSFISNFYIKMKDVQLQKNIKDQLIQQIQSLQNTIDEQNNRYREELKKNRLQFKSFMDLSMDNNNQDGAEGLGVLTEENNQSIEESDDHLVDEIFTNTHQQQTEEIEKTLSESKKKIEFLQLQITEIDKKISQLEETIESLKAQLDDAQKNISTQEDIIKKRQQRKNARTLEIKNLETRLKNVPQLLENVLNDIETKHKTELNELLDIQNEKRRRSLQNKKTKSESSNFLNIENLKTDGQDTKNTLENLLNNDEGDDKDKEKYMNNAFNVLDILDKNNAEAESEVLKLIFKNMLDLTIDEPFSLPNDLNNEILLLRSSDTSDNSPKAICNYIIQGLLKKGVVVPCGPLLHYFISGEDVEKKFKKDVYKKYQWLIESQLGQTFFDKKIDHFDILPDGDLVFLLGSMFNNHIEIVDSISGNCKRSFVIQKNSTFQKKFNNTSSAIKCFTVLKDGSIVIGLENRKTCVFNPNTGEMIKLLNCDTRHLFDLSDSNKFLSVVNTSATRFGFFIGSLENEENAGLITIPCIKNFQTLDCILAKKIISISNTFPHHLQLLDYDTEDFTIDSTDIFEDITCVMVTKPTSVIANNNTTGVNFIQNCYTIIACSDKGNVYTWKYNAETDGCVFSKKFKIGTNKISCGAILSNNNAIICSKNTIKEMDPETGEIVRKIKYINKNVGGGTPIMRIHVLPSDNFITQFEDGSIREWMRRLSGLTIMQLALVIKLCLLKKQERLVTIIHPEWVEIFDSLPDDIKQRFSFKLIEKRDFLDSNKIENKNEKETKIEFEN